MFQRCLEPLLSASQLCWSLQPSLCPFVFVWVVITDGNFADFFITVKEIKIELTPTLQIEAFIGDRHFGESVQLDEVALQRSQSIGTKAMKAALKGKRKADKEREALINAEGIDSIATIKEHLEAEAIEAELEGGNKGAEK